MREIATPHGGLAGADPQIDLDHDVARFHVRHDGGFIVALDTLAIPRDGDTTNSHTQQITIGLLATFAHGHDDTTPVGVFPGDGSFDQR